MAISIRVRGVVQGVGFRPFIWHLATALGITGSVWNDAEGVIIEAWGSPEALEQFRQQIMTQPPPLARIDRIECCEFPALISPPAFTITASTNGSGDAAITPDAATCPACLADINTPSSRHFHYPFTSCTHCGPRLSIVRTTPYDRCNTSMAPFTMCPTCQSEYDDPANRRFHAQTHACPACGPQIWLEERSGHHVNGATGYDAIVIAASLLKQGRIIAIKGIGGIQLAVDAGNAEAVTRLRSRKKREGKAFALMGRDISSIACHADINGAEQQQLSAPSTPIVLLKRKAHNGQLADAIAPGQSRLGFMLPNTPLHHLLMAQMDHPIVLTSGNRSDEPQCTDNNDARNRLGDIADYLLLHNRDIVNRLDDSVVAVMADKPRMIRRARGYAPAPILLHHSFEHCAPVLAMGGELKSSFCQLNDGKATLSQHIGDLENATTSSDYLHMQKLYRQMFDFTPECIAIDQHPDYFSSRIGAELATQSALPLLTVQHHHAHMAAIMAENQLSLDCKPVLGVSLDGLGLGADGTLWGGEFLLADYHHYKRLASFQPVAMPGGTQAIREPWRNCFAHLHACGWSDISSRFANTGIIRFLHTQPLPLLHRMIENSINTPLSSSCGRLFDAVAAALGICREQILYEGEAAIELETVARTAWHDSIAAYPWRLDAYQSLQIIDWSPMWQALLDDLQRNTPTAEIAARFHRTLNCAICTLALQLCHRHAVNTVVLCGGAFQNRLLLESVADDLSAKKIRILMAGQTPLNDGGLALGQAAIAAATQWKKGEQHD